MVATRLGYSCTIVSFLALVLMAFSIGAAERVLRPFLPTYLAGATLLHRSYDGLGCATGLFAFDAGTLAIDPSDAALALERLNLLQQQEIDQGQGPAAQLDQWEPSRGFADMSALSASAGKALDCLGRGSAELETLHRRIGDGDHGFVAASGQYFVLMIPSENLLLLKLHRN
jgi:hypothetical protein